MAGGITGGNHCKLLIGIMLIITVAPNGMNGISSKLPRTSANANQMSAANSNSSRTSVEEMRPNKTTSYSSAASGMPLSNAASARIKEQYIFSVFEAIISTFDSKLQRIENLDKAVEHLMRRVESLDVKVSSSIDRNDAIVHKLNGQFLNIDSCADINQKLVFIDQKTNEISDKLTVSRNYLDNNYVQNVDYITNSASSSSTSGTETPPIANMNTIDESARRISQQLRKIEDSSDNIDKTLQFYAKALADGLYIIQNQISDIHEAIVADEKSSSTSVQHQWNGTATSRRSSSPFDVKLNKIDTLVRQMRPIVSVSEKMGEVWDVVVGTKSSVDNLLPKSDELLTQTQRQERAIGEIHSDLRRKTNRIIANLDKVDKRLKKQEDDVATLAQRSQDPAEGALKPTVETFTTDYDATISHQQLLGEPVMATKDNTPLLETSSAFPSMSDLNSSFASIASLDSSVTNSTSVEKQEKRKGGGVVFPSVKNKPFLSVNTTFTAEISPTTKDVKGYSCFDLLSSGFRDSGVYYLQIRGTTYWFLKVYCEQVQSDGGWTVIQRRDDFGEPRENFNRDWNDYKNGFGHPDNEFWLGNENIYMLTNNEEYLLRIELEDFDGNKRYAQYSHFKIYSEAEYYKLDIDGYEGDAGDSLNDPWYGSNNSPFSTYNRDNDRSSLNCASMLKGGWWWKSCGRGLNGFYLSDPQDLSARQGIVWFRWKGWDYTLKRARMMIKPKGYLNANNR